MLVKLRTCAVILFFSLAVSVASAQSVTLDFWTGKIAGDKFEMTYPVQVPVREGRSVPYTVQVPYTEEIELDDGAKKEVVKYRTEKRERIVEVTKLVTEFRTRTMPIAGLDDLKFLDLHGDEISGMKLRGRFTNKTAVVRIEKESDITPQLRLLLSDDVLFQIVDRPKK